MNGSGRTYSKWIGRLSRDDFPCDEFGLFLLSFVFKRHVLVILADTTWCTFKFGHMTTFEKICKADHVLVWMGEDRYSEVKPLQIKTSLSAGNIAEWQQLTESVDLLHSKAKGHARRVEKATASISTPVKHPKPVSPARMRQLSKRDSKVSIDYKQLHEDGVFEEKRRHVEKFPPRSSGPSETRLEAQKQIVRSKRSPGPNTNTRKVATGSHNQYNPLRKVTVSENNNVQLKIIKQERITHYRPQPIKPEPGIYLRHQENPRDRE